ncbi:all trans-polyprenyl-diphosphate synthase PDSS1-like isoform X2 [Tigriopus californicus]|uniref:all trans-polyprenyl-diphosphate synthase PDSS1-like isoform X2 n=1 Tax=Tigriopus californicus TaxID=6832 RepID=UPI0027DA6A0D|nr:all trans-polyprenyl-diphosphate synthase PDSS1-like isoform X2 [Tigriopus californicus]
MYSYFKTSIPRLFQQSVLLRSSSSSKALNAHPNLDINLNILAYGPAEAVEVNNVAKHYFNSQGKNIRPNMTLLMAKAVNSHLGLDLDFNVYSQQMKVAEVAEMYHTASLMHDDVLDHAEVRRGRPSVNSLWGELSSIRGGNFAVGLASSEVAKLKNDEVLYCMSKILESLVIGELQQMSASHKGNNSDARFQRYLAKTFNKTASLMAYSCQSAAILAECKAGQDRQLSTMAYNYGKDMGIAFQLMDDWLDFVVDAEQLGKPSSADLKLGLATAPVLFACEEHPEAMGPLIERKFSGPNDVEKALKIVMKSNGLNKTKALAENFCQSAILSISSMRYSQAKSDLEDMLKFVLCRMR